MTSRCSQYGSPKRSDIDVRQVKNISSHYFPLQELPIVLPDCSNHNQAMPNIAKVRRLVSKEDL